MSIAEPFSSVSEEKKIELAGKFIVLALTYTAPQNRSDRKSLGGVLSKTGLNELMRTTIPLTLYQYPREGQNTPISIPSNLVVQKKGDSKSKYRYFNSAVDALKEAGLVEIRLDNNGWQSIRVTSAGIQYAQEIVQEMVEKYPPKPSKAVASPQTSTGPAL